MGVSKTSGTPKSLILIGFAIINHPFWGTPIFWKQPYSHIYSHMYIYIYVYTYDLSNEPIRPGHGFGATHLQDIGERVLHTGCNPQQFNQDVMGGLMEIDRLFFSRMLDYCHGYCLHWHFQETRSFLSCNYLGIGSRAKLRLKGLFLLGGKIALTAIRSRINRTLIKTNMKAENNMLEVRNPICNVLRL